MELANKKLLDAIIKGNLYRDKKSKERPTSVTKSKLKLAANHIPELEQYFFNILTKRSSSCSKYSKLTIKREDWENVIDDKYLKEEVSYCDLVKVDIIGKMELLDKLKDHKNKFRYIAKLCSSKYDELQKLREKIDRYPFIPEQVKRVVTVALSDIIDEIALNLGLL